MLRHILLFDFSENVKKNKIETVAFKKIKESVETLRQIKEVKNVSISLNLSDTSDLVFYTEFESEEDLKKYQTSVLHLAHVNRTKEYVENRRVIDFKVE